LREVPDAHPAFGHVARPLAVAARREERQRLALVPPAELVACREALARAADDLHAHVRICVALAQRRDDLAPQRVVHRVALLSTVQRDAPNVRRGGVDQYDGVVGHAAIVVALTACCQRRTGPALVLRVNASALLAFLTYPEADLPLLPGPILARERH